MFSEGFQRVYEGLKTLEAELVVRIYQVGKRLHRGFRRVHSSWGCIDMTKLLVSSLITPKKSPA